MNCTLTSSSECLPLSPEGRGLTHWQDHGLPTLQFHRCCLGGYARSPYLLHGGRLGFHCAHPSRTSEPLSDLRGSVLTWPQGFIILCGSLELASRNIVSGAVRVCFSIIYSLFLGFGLSIGATAYSKMTHHDLAGTDDLSCQSSHDANGPWWQRTPSVWWGAFVKILTCSVCVLTHGSSVPYRTSVLVLLESA